ncbi:Lantibiotic alpha [Butyrivibrio sp. ob235]|uniref:plantaricin C family lantibiotic n=1 Tax=Butyrivibrio sp. ob235 TaxID=1761780 RepID=UPI0008D19D7A|nr:plantaricin C family lantibiotic [Butyrivibrio sp. ob235]SEL83110.1 Lantibiotic alpha [Butyrivibrio sp. ob235]
MGDLNAIKDPVLRQKMEILTDPNANVSIELTEQDMQALAGAGWYSEMSAALGNRGSYCTLTKECQACCN